MGYSKSYNETDGIGVGIEYEGTTTKVFVKIEDLTGEGIAKLNPIDVYSKDIGVGIALARALKELGTSAEKQ